MTTGDERNFLNLVDAVLDGRPVDWSAHAFEDESVRRRIVHLQTLERIAALHRSAEDGADAPDLSGSAWGHLSLRQRMASGKAAEVYRAFDISLEREVALKLERPMPSGEKRETLIAEGRRLARLRHPHVVTVYGIDRFQERAGIWTELIRGRTLEDLLATQGPQSAQEAALIGLDLCRALAAVHEAGIVHRDVKTTNVMREDGGRIVLMDFGIGVDRQPAPSTTAGSPMYMAPELIAGEPATPSADLYALGVLLFRILTGAYPCRAENIAALQRSREEGRQQSLRALRPDIPVSLVQVVEKALSLHPRDRYPDAAAMERALAATLKFGTDASPVRRLSRIRPSLLFVSLTLILGLSALVLRTATLAGRLSVEATLLRRTAEGDRVLQNGDRVDRGDRLYLQFESSRPVHLYVLDEDAAGRGFVLFPVPGLDLQNPLPSGINHRIPGLSPDGWRTWEVDTSGGEETLLLIAAERPLAELEAAVNTYPPAGSVGSEPATSPNVIPRLRGVGRLVVESEPPPRPSRKSIDDILADLGRSESDARDIWIRRIHLENSKE